MVFAVVEILILVFYKWEPLKGQTGYNSMRTDILKKCRGAYHNVMGWAG
jgi:hypothetical protein